jgi:hypothetical protein
VFKHEDKTNFKYIKDWITLENIVNNSQLALDYLSLTASNIDVISLDLDGNDIYFVEELLKNKFKPKLFIVEYNAKFPPPVRFKIDYNSNHTWKGDDFFGASLTSFDDVFRANNYTLVCCNISGSNAFFIHDSLIHSFEDVPK